MVYVRKSAWANGGDFNDPILYWYAMGVRALKQKGLNDATGWRFIAAIHGIDTRIWQSDGYYTPGEPLPSPSDQALYWNQCQHQSWYFLPWHRGYIWSIETLVRNEIIKQNGPTDWAMPYWNYSDTHVSTARLLPPAFSRTTLPDGSPNPLYVSQRYGTGAPNVVLPAGDVTLGALTIPYFTGTGTGALTGFGGVKTGFSHSGSANGQLESKPHNLVHVDIGGRTKPGLMSDPDTAGLDPIFWLHHANIDRLWVVWNTSNPAHTNPTDAAWLNGPINRKFVVPDASGNAYTFTPAQTQITTNAPWNYTYDQVVAANATLALSAPLAAETRTVTEPRDAELLSTNTSAIAITGKGTSDILRFDQSIAPPAIDFSPKAIALRAGSPPPARLYLNLKNIRAAADGAIIDVYLNLPEGADHESRPDRLAGSFALFGARKASREDAEHSGLGLSEVFDVTDLVARIGHSGELGDGKQLQVRLVSRDEPADAAKITIEQISLYRA